MYWAGTFGGVFVTDDQGAMGFARRRFPGLRVFDTVDVLRECFENAEIGCPLGTTTKKDTVNRALRETAQRLRRAQALAHLAELGEAGAFDELHDPSARRP